MKFAIVSPFLLTCYNLMSRVSVKIFHLAPSVILLKRGCNRRIKYKKYKIYAKTIEKKLPNDYILYVFKC